MNFIRVLHLFVGYGIPFGFLVLALWSLWSLLIKKEPPGGYWSLLGMLQAIIGVQFVFGAVLFLSGRRPLGGGGPIWLHYVYGAFFPALVLVVAHRWARRVPTAPWLIFGFAGLVCFGLTFRALQTGLS